jgi:hypothetical protein
MEYKKIEKLVYNNNLIKRENYKTKKEYDLKLDSMLIENLNKCIEKKVPIKMDENDLAKIYKVYLKLVKNNYQIDSSFIKNIVDLSEKKLDFFDIISSITE